MELQVTMDGVACTVTVKPAEGGWNVRVDDGPERFVAGRSIGKSERVLTVDGKRHVVGEHAKGGRVDLQAFGRAWRADVIDARKAALQLGAGGSAGLVITQMPGVIVRLLVAPGDAVTEGDPVIVVEAMKMENEFKAPVSGTVEAIHVEAGQPVESGAALLTITPDEE